MINQIMSNLATLFNQDNNPQVPKLDGSTQQGQTPKIEQPDYLSTQQHISTIAPNAQEWGRKEWRQWRKNQGLSKQEMRNIRAQALVGTQAPRDVSRGDLKRIERNVKSQTPGMALYAVSGRDSGRKVNQVTNALEGIASRWDGKTPMQVKNVPIEIEEVIEEEPLPGQVPVQPVSPITYNWGNTVNSYWQGQNEKVLNSLSDEERRKIAGDDGVITADEAKAWQTGMGLSGDLKFGSGTIGAASTKYGNNFNATPFKGYTNPINSNPQVKDNGSPAKTSGTGIKTQPVLPKAINDNFWNMWGTLAFK